jgi:exodeoxyribonuclease-5
MHQYMLVDAPAGRGKTFTIGAAIGDLYMSDGTRGAPIAFTGRAAAQLRKSGIDASTMHSLIYNPVYDSDGVFNRFEQKSREDIRELLGDYILIDEASMFPKKELEFLASFNIPIILSGDENQLPAIDKDNPNFNCMIDVPGNRVRLTVNRRVDPGSLGIAEISEYVKAHNAIPRVRRPGFSALSRSKLSSVSYHEENRFDVILCGTNKLRRSVNTSVRRARGFDSDVPSIGEIIICKQNQMLGESGSAGKINNGELFEILNIIDGTNISTFLIRNLDTQVQYSVNVYNETWTTEEIPKDHKPKRDGAVSKFTFGYCISVHASQGSTFDSVLFIDEDVSYFLDNRKFRYTGLTRAAKQLVAAI